MDASVYVRALSGKTGDWPTDEIRPGFESWNMECGLFSYFVFLEDISVCAFFLHVLT